MTKEPRPVDFCVIHLASTFLSITFIILANRLLVYLLLIYYFLGLMHRPASPRLILISNPGPDVHGHAVVISVVPRVSSYHLASIKELFYLSFSLQRIVHTACARPIISLFALVYSFVLVFFFGIENSSKYFLFKYCRFFFISFRRRPRVSRDYSAIIGLINTSCIVVFDLNIYCVYIFIYQVDPNNLLEKLKINILHHQYSKLN